jgi:uncharacterized protein (DUF2344 family)
VSQDESPLHSRPRITAALALALGATSGGELLELCLTRRVPPSEALSLLRPQLPAGMQMAVVGEFPVSAASGKVLTLGSAISGAEWIVLLCAPSGEDRPPAGDADFAAWTETLLASDSFEWRKKTKGGARQTINLRPALLHLSLASPEEAAQLCSFAGLALVTPLGTVALRLTGASGIDTFGQGMLTPEHLCTMLGRVAGRPVELLHAHRLRILVQDGGEELSEAQAAVQAEEAVRAMVLEAERAEARAAAGAVGGEQLADEALV